MELRPVEVITHGKGGYGVWRGLFSRLEEQKPYRPCVAGPGGISLLGAPREGRSLGRGRWKFTRITCCKKSLDPNSRKLVPCVECDFPLGFPFSFLSVSLSLVCLESRAAHVWCTKCKTSPCPVTRETAALGILPELLTWCCTLFMFYDTRLTI